MNRLARTKLIKEYDFPKTTEEYIIIRCREAEVGFKDIYNPDWAGIIDLVTFKQCINEVFLVLIVDKRNMSEDWTTGLQAGKVERDQMGLQGDYYRNSIFPHSFYGA